MKVSKNARIIPPSGTMQMSEMATAAEASGKTVIHLEVGEPDFKTPQPIIDELCRAARSGNTKYTSARGISELRTAIAKYLSNRKIEYDPNHEIIATPGSKHALFMAMQALLDPGDEVLILTPAWPTYMGIPLSLGAKPIEIPLTSEFAVDEETIKSTITKNSRVLLVNSPSNPTGKGFSDGELTFLADIAHDNDLSVISDEVYSQIIFTGFHHKSISSLPGMSDRTLVIDGFSKTFAMTGWRLGWCAGPKNVISTMVKLQQASTSCPASMIQKAGAFALQDVSLVKHVQEMVREYQRRRDFLVPALNEIPNITCRTPEGAFYAFLKYEAPKTPSRDLALQLLKAKGVSTTAGAEFGMAGEYHLRVSFASSLEQLQKGVHLMSEFFTEGGT